MLTAYSLAQQLISLTANLWKDNMDFLDKICKYLNRALICIGGIFLIGMIILTCANIFFRLAWVPIRGTFELMGFFGAVVAAFALGYTQINRGHISVNVLVSIFPERTKRVLSVINSALCMFFFIIVTWQITKKATIIWNTGEVTETLRIIYYPFTYGVAFGCAVLSLVFLTDLIKVLFPEKGGEK